MAQRHKVRTSSQTDSYRLTADERRAARTAEIASKQGQLKREAAERRAKREHEAQTTDGASPSTSSRAGGSRR